MSTLSGIVAGVVVAAVVTVYYGDALNRVLAGLAPAASGGPDPGAALQKPVAVAVSTAPVAAAPLQQSAMAEVEVSPVADPAQPAAVDQLEQRWLDYASRADQWQPRGEFRWRECFVRAAATHGVPEALLLAVASGESGFDPTARSGQDAVGLMQIQWPGTSHHLGITREADLYDPCTNISAGARYLAELSQRYGRDLYRTVAAYNYGPGRIGEGELPQGAHWYAGYIYQHLQRVLGQASGPMAAVESAPSRAGGYEVLLSFNQHYRARDFLAFLQSQAPELDLAQRSELMGRHEVVLLYDDAAQRERGMQTIQRTGLLAFAPEYLNSQQERDHEF